MFRFAIAGLALVLATGSAQADIMPEPDVGPPMADVAGLSFSVQDVTVKYPAGYTKSQQVVILTGCTEGTRNCALAKSKHVIGLEVLSVNDESLHTELGMVRQIVDAFQNNKWVTLELFDRDSGGSYNDTIKVRFAGKP
jgi:hypothetical protein